jgi:hypothetical protein
MLIIFSAKVKERRRLSVLSIILCWLWSVKVGSEEVSNNTVALDLEIDRKTFSKGRTAGAVINIVDIFFHRDFYVSVLCS